VHGSKAVGKGPSGLVCDDRIQKKNSVLIETYDEHVRDFVFIIDGIMQHDDGMLHLSHIILIEFVEDETSEIGRRAHPSGFVRRASSVQDGAVMLLEIPPHKNDDSSGACLFHGDELGRVKKVSGFTAHDYAKLGEAFFPIGTFRAKCGDLKHNSSMLDGEIIVHNLMSGLLGFYTEFFDTMHLLRWYVNNFDSFILEAKYSAIIQLWI
jgi:hypothetical protein